MCNDIFDLHSPFSKCFVENIFCFISQSFLCISIHDVDQRWISRILYINSLRLPVRDVTFCCRTCSLSPRTIHVRFRAATAVVDADTYIGILGRTFSPEFCWTPSFLEFMCNFGFGGFFPSFACLFVFFPLILITYIGCKKDV